MKVSGHIVGVVVAVVAGLSYGVARELWRARQARSSAPAAGGGSRNKIVRRIEISPTLGAHIFQRPGGSFGYYLAHKVSAPEEADRWTGSAETGPGSAFGTAELAEEYARKDAASGA
jgi:hypothetical protein